MSFVHGHVRDTGWVVAHLRPPTDADEGQLPLVEPSAEEGDQNSGDAPAASAPASSASTRS